METFEFRKDYQEWFSSYKDVCQTLIYQLEIANESISNLNEAVWALGIDWIEEWQANTGAILSDMQTLHTKLEKNAQTIFQTLTDLINSMEEFLIKAKQNNSELDSVLYTECEKLLVKNYDTMGEFETTLFKRHEIIDKLQKEHEKYKEETRYMREDTEEVKFVEELEHLIGCIEADFDNIVDTHNEIEHEQHLLEKEFDYFVNEENCRRNETCVTSRYANNMLQQRINDENLLKLPLPCVESILILNKHKYYEHMQERERTFVPNNWFYIFHRIGKSPREMALCGFRRHFQHADSCICVFCDAQLGNWDKDDNPFLEHERWNPNCRWIQHLKRRLPQLFRPFPFHASRSLLDSISINTLY